MLKQAHLSFNSLWNLYVREFIDGIVIKIFDLLKVPNDSNFIRDGVFFCMFHICHMAVGLDLVIGAC